MDATVAPARPDADRWTRPDPAPWPARLLAAAVALLVTAPALAPGFVLLRDMVFVPRQDLDLDALGLGGTLPRAVPVDAVMGLLTAVVPGDLVQKLVLLGIVYFAVLGAARLVPAGPDGRRGAAGLVAGLVYGWSPYLAERLLMGHWTLLLGFAALPWVARAAFRLRAGEPRALARLVLCAAPAALSPTGALLAAGVVVAVLRGRRLLLACAALLLLALPWLVAGLLHPSGGASDPAGVAAFAARAEGWGGTVLSVLGTGGIWNADAAPASRSSPAAPLLALAVGGLAAVGWRVLLRRGAGRGLLLLGAVGLALACAAAAPAAAGLLELLVREVPGAGLLRDGQKWAAWWALALAVGAGAGARELAHRAGERGGASAGRAVLAAALLLPVVALPDLAWGVAGRLEPVGYPADWQRVRDLLAADERPGDVLVLPFGAYRAFGWNDGRTLYDPASRWLDRPTVADDALVVDGRAVPGEDLRARTAGAAVDDPPRLAALGIGWVLVEQGTPGPPVPGAIGALPVVHEGPALTLHRVPGAVDGPRPHPVRVTAVTLAHAGALGIVGGAALWIMAGASTVTRRRPPLRKRVPG
ncbi:hypothetical protein [Blastococcus sp. VKM Ac-2987]|uniref:hypothetical protein n=1 Tax=Blastococcus sp. VKM Ac-2987 TaxID=3004141 RepID=UPI0022AB589A|nr:hypothetical protein [Blastococcus sp. VKM Ac-2987]MCZ2860376.1 hypothetical protein [Blastococcus sp. VKM Ac-2987]